MSDTKIKTAKTQRMGDFMVNSLLVTPALAERWLNECQFAGQRSVSPNHVNFLVETMRRGEFKAGQLEFRSHAGRRYLTDGQHRLHAILASGISQPMVCLERQVDSYEDVQREYARTDRGRARSMAAALGAFGLSDRYGWTTTQTQRLAGAAVILARGFGPPQSGGYAGKSAETREELLSEFAAEATSYFGALAGGAARITDRLQAAPPLAVALVTMRHQEERARPFWERVAHNDALRPGEPGHTLVDFLIANTIVSRGPQYYARAVAAAWNAEYQGRELKQIKVLDPNAPIEIKGTPYTGEVVIALVPESPGLDRQARQRINGKASAS